MAYFIFSKNSDNIINTIVNIAENQSDFNYLNKSPDLYKIIEVSQDDFNNVKYGRKYPSSYNNNVINYVDIVYGDGEQDTRYNKINIQDYINNIKSRIKVFTDNNPNHELFNKWNNYYNQLNSLNLDNITYPLKKSLEQHLVDIGQTALHPLEII